MEIRYEFLQAKELTSKDVSDISFLLSVLTTHPPVLNQKYLEEVVSHLRVISARDVDQEKRIVGMGSLAVVTQMVGKMGHLEDIVVHPEYRRKGVGRHLIEELISEGKKLQIKHIDLTSRPARIDANRLYQSLGFQLWETNVYRLKLD